MQPQSIVARTCRPIMRMALPVALALFTIGLTAPEARGQAVRTLHSFVGATNGTDPRAALIQGQDGALYGTTSAGGANGTGTVFKVKTDGTGYQTLYASGASAVIQGKDGALYGTNVAVFKLNTDGTGFQTLYSFTDGSGACAVIQGKDGALYGTTGGGAYDSGTVFKLNTDGTGFQTLYTFTGGNDGFDPFAALIQGKDGALYGTTESGGANGGGTVFKLNTNGTGFQTLYSFSIGDGVPEAALIQGKDGALYGTTSRGGANQDGTVFRMNTNGSGFQTLCAFSGADITSPYAAVIQGKDGALYGTTRDGGAYNEGAMFRVNTNGSGFQTLFNFSYGSDGAYPDALIQGKDGALYGTTGHGGENDQGALFRVKTDGTGFQTLHTFVSPFSLSANPGALIQGKDGALYGATVFGGVYDEGTVFKLNTDGTGFQTLYNFPGGIAPASLIQGQDGALYGTTSEGGANGTGTIFRMNTDGTGYRTVYSFSADSNFNNLDGANPGALIQGQDGALYGTTDAGGAFANGTIFKLNTDGTGFQTLYDFGLIAILEGLNDGYQPLALMQGQDGALYGTAASGGADNEGTVFSLNTDGSYQILYSFGSDGYWPQAGLIQGQDGALYGTTSLGGANQDGTVFKLNTDGTGYRTVYSFSADSGGNTDGADPHALIRGSDGSVYGTALSGGSTDSGTVFKLVRRAHGFDANGDGSSDILFRDTHTGDVVLWEMNGLNVLNQGFVARTVSLQWQVAGTGDFNRDGMDDILWRNTSTGDVYLWEMNGFNILNQGYISRGVSSVWQVAGTGDFNGDGMDDILWRNTNTGDVYLWEMNGFNILSQGYVAHDVLPQWQVAGIGDFNGDGLADVLWRNTSTGDVYLWEMNGFNILSQGYISRGVSSVWQVAGTGDFNGDGMDDILWRNTSTGDVYLWEMNGFSIANQGYIYQALPLVWQIAAP